MSARQNFIPFLSVLILTLTLTSCSKNSLTADGKLDTLNCDPSHGMTPLCGFTNPEDLVIIADGTKLLVSEMGIFMQDTPGSLSLLDIASGQKQSIKIIWENKGETWGDNLCPQPQTSLFSPHGIDLMTRTDGKEQLLVVNHGGREAVEFFELSQLNKQWQLHWKGCALPPDDPFINDVAGLKDGGFLVTHMWDKNQPYLMLILKYLVGINTGWVWEWQPQGGFNKLAGSSGSGPNGIVVSADNSKIYVNLYGDNKTIKIDRLTGLLEDEFEVQQPDNITLDEEGNLWVASHKHNPITQDCADVVAGPCLLPFEIVKADAKTMQTEVVLSHQGAPTGYSTVALKVGNNIFMGSAHGDRIVSFMLPNEVSKAHFYHHQIFASK
jgi:hypothetical protein